MAHDVVVTSRHRLHPLVPHQLGHLNGAFNVAEEAGDGAVGGAVRAQVRTLYRGCGGYRVNGGSQVPGGDTLKRQLPGQHFRGKEYIRDCDGQAIIRRVAYSEAPVVDGRNLWPREGGKMVVRN